MRLQLTSQPDWLTTGRVVCILYWEKAQRFEPTYHSTRVLSWGPLEAGSGQWAVNRQAANRGYEFAVQLRVRLPEGGQQRAVRCVEMHGPASLRVAAFP